MLIGFPAFFANTGGSAPDITSPTITSANTASVDEDVTLSHTLTANESVTWSIVGGVDQAQFEISGSTLRWASNGTQDYEDPQDDDTDNDYIVQVRATDAATNFTNQTITLTVNDVSAAFSPSDIASLQIWYKMDELSGSDGDLVAALTDASGNGNHAAQPSSGNRPILELAEIDGKNVIRFHFGSNHSMLLPTGVMSAWSGGTLLGVIKNIVGDVGSPFFTGGHSDSNHYPYFDSVVYDGNLSSARKSTGVPALTLTTTHILGITSGASHWALRHNGITHYTTGTNTYASGTSHAPRMGDGVTAPWSGLMGEVAVFDEVLSSTNREKMEGYLAHKWGLEGLLDSGHPYKASPP
jgi:hypothetical protein